MIDWPDAEPSPYRDKLAALHAELAALRAENARLRRQLDTVFDLPPFSTDETCRMCGRKHCITTEYEPARPPQPARWWRNADGGHEAYMRRRCYVCRAVYFERPLVETRAPESP